MEPFHVIYITFLENLDSFLYLTGAEQGFSMEVTIWKRLALSFKTSIFSQVKKKKKSEFSDFQ